MDGSLTEATLANPDPEVLPSASGTSINGRRLESGEKRLLKHGDRITLVPNQLELLYVRPDNKVTHKIEDLTYAPVELPTE
jgi:pSer/pThr/pTyr-binding forkhead associated (FHA) protein